MTRRGVETTIDMSTTSTCPLNVSKKTDFIDMFKECVDIQDTTKGPIAEPMGIGFFQGHRAFIL
jgi:hypothetical protein